MPNLYKIQIRDSLESEWRDMHPIKGLFNTIDLSYNEARSIVSDFNGLSKTKNHRTIKQGKNDVIKPCTICNKSIKIQEDSGTSDGGVTYTHDACRRNKMLTGDA